MDVHDVAWAPDDTLLASCSIDNNVLIWRLPNINNTAAGGGVVNVILGPERRLSGHSSWVKGLAWDPMGTFLASASDDRSVVIWRTSDWQVKYIPFYFLPHNILNPHSVLNYLVLLQLSEHLLLLLSFQ